MQLHKLRLDRVTAVLGACWLLATAAWGDTLTFVAQPAAGGGLDPSWFSFGNWFTTDSTGNLVPAGRVPLADESAIITGLVDLEATGVRVQTLVATNNATITNGTVAIENLQLLTGSSLNNSTVNVLVGLTVGGTNCTLNATTLSILGIASGTLQAVAPATASSLVLSRGSVFQSGGALSLTDRSQISGGGLPQSRLVIQPGALLSSTNSATIRGAATGHLIVDNSGTVRVDGGTLSCIDGIDWQSSAGSEEFRATTPSSLILFISPFHVDSGVTCSFTGTGTNRWLAGAGIDGIAQVSGIDSGTQLAGPGNLEILESLTGSGLLHFLGTTNQGGVGNWSNGTISLAGLSVDPGAALFIGGAGGSSRQLAGGAITNFGSCILSGGALSFSQGAVFNNQAGATCVAQADGAFSSSAGGGTFNNAGTFQKLSFGVSQFGVTNSGQGPDFNNTGLVDLRGGQLNLLGGVSSGEFRQAQGTVLWFWGGTYALNPGTTFTGPGAVRLFQGAAAAEWLVNDSIAVPQLELGANGTLDASGAPPGKPIQLGTLISHDNAVITNGTFQVQTFQMLDESLLALSLINVGALTVAGTNCTLSATTLNLQPGALAIFRSASPGAGVLLTLTQGAVLEDAGQLTLTDGSIIAGGSSPSSKLVIQPGAILSSTNSAGIHGSTKGLLTVDNRGTISVDGGTLTLGDGLEWQSSSGLGEFRAGAPNALLVFTGRFQVSSGVTSLFTGSGTSRWLGGALIDGTAQVGGVVSGSLPALPGNVAVASSLSGAGSVHVLGGSTQAGTVSWSNGTASLARLDIDAGGMLRIGGGTGTSRQLSGCVINNAGSCVVFEGDLLLAQSAMINNLVGGTFLLQTNVGLGLAPASGSGILNNAGTFLNSSPIGLSTVGADFNNSGKFEIISGTLAFQGAWNQTQGTTLVDPGATLSGATLKVLGGTLSGTGTIDANLVNTAGSVSPGLALGILSTSTGKTYQQGTSASLAVAVGGTVPGSEYEQFAVGGAASLDGQLLLRFVNGFVPQPGQTFTVLTCANLGGTFATITAPPLAGTVWVPRYNGTNVTLALADKANLARSSISGGALNLPVSTTPGIRYVVQAADELSPANWQTLTTIAGDGTVTIVSDPVTRAHRFYRVLLQ